MMRSSISLLSLLAVVSIVAAGCGGKSPLRSDLDSSGMTIVTLDRPTVLARSALDLTSTGRDYIYLGPVEINRMGERKYFVWLGMASTVDRPLVDEEQPRAASLTLLVDGSPMELPLTSWNLELDRPPYRSGVKVYDAYAARASLDQIDRIARAASVDIDVITDAGRSTDYRKWRGEWSQWAAFADQGQDHP